MGYDLPPLTGLKKIASTSSASSPLLLTWIGQNPNAGSIETPKSSERRYDGLTLDQWRERIKNLKLDSPASAEAVPGLLAITQDPKAPWFSRRQAAEALGRIGRFAADDAVPVLTKYLQSEDASDESPRLWAAKALALFGRDAAPAVPAAVAVLRDDALPLEHRVVVLELLGRVGPAHPQAIPALIETLNRPAVSGDDAERAALRLRTLAAEALGLVGANAGVAVPALLRATLDPDELLRRRAVAALGAIGPAAAVGVPSLIETMALDESPAVRDAAGVALSQLGPTAVEPLADLLGDREAELRLRAASALGRMGTTASPAADALKTTLGDEVLSVRLAAADALWRIASDAAAAAPVLIDALAAEDRQQRMQAYRLLVEIGQQDDSIAAKLQPLLDDNRPHVRQAASKALEKIREATQ